MTNQNARLTALVRKLAKRKNCPVCLAQGGSPSHVMTNGVYHSRGKNGEITCELEAILAGEAECDHDWDYKEATARVCDKCHKVAFIGAKKPPAAASGEAMPPEEPDDPVSVAFNRGYDKALVDNGLVTTPPSPSDPGERCECKHGCLNFAISGENYCHDCGYAVWWEHDTSHGQPETEATDGS